MLFDLITKSGRPQLYRARRRPSEIGHLAAPLSLQHPPSASSRAAPDVELCVNGARSQARLRCWRVQKERRAVVSIKRTQRRTSNGRSPQLVQQRLRLLQIGHVEALAEPAVNRREEVAGLGSAALVAAQPGKAHGGAQFPQLRLLLAGDP